MDMQFVPDPYGAAVYVVDYINKSGRGISKLIKETADEVRKGNLPLAEQLRTISNTFVNKSEVSAQEAAMHIMGLPMVEASVAEVYINTSPPEQRVRLSKAPSHLQQMLQEHQGDSTEWAVVGLIEHYAQRPDVLENHCLADFAALYSFHTKKKTRARRQEVVQLDDDVDDDLVVEEGDPVNTNSAQTNIQIHKDLPLKDGSGFVTRRAKDKRGNDNPKVIRYRNYSAIADPDNFMREQLMLFTHWRDEAELAINTAVLFQNNVKEITENRSKYVKLDIDMEEVLQQVLADKRDDVDPVEDPDDPPPEYAVFEGGDDIQADIGQDIAPDVLNVNDQASDRFLLPRHKPDEEYLKDIARLNERQRRYHLEVTHILKTHPDKQFLHFVSGGAGVGKSAMINAIVQTAIRVFVKQGLHPDHLTVVLLAPTGCAAWVIQAVTIASGLHIFSQNLNMTLGADALNTLRAQLQHSKLFIVDEISMVGRNVFSMMNQRLQQIFDNKEVFGGKSMIVVGDLNQLRPVMDSFAFECGGDDLEVLSGPFIWRAFKHYRLTEVMRQRDDKAFAEALNRIPYGETTPEDDIMFASREVARLSAVGIFPPKDSLHLFEWNNDVDGFNSTFLKTQNTEGCVVTCADYCQGEGTSKAKKSAIKMIQQWNLSKTQNLPGKVEVKLDVPYMVTVNIKTADGLTNGAIGMMRHIAYGRGAGQERAVTRFYLEFSDEAVGRQTRTDNCNMMRLHNVQHNWTPIERVVRSIIPYKGALFKINRKQFPIVVAKAMTVYKSQGKTVITVEVHHNPNRKMDRHSMYVAYSRPTSLEGLIIHGRYQRPNPPTDKDPVMLEWRRLDQPENQVNFSLKFPELSVDGSGVVAVFHNICSLNSHYDHVLQDLSYIGSDILMICETRTMPQQDISIPGFSLLHRRDCIKLTRHPYGTALYVKDRLVDRVNVLHQDCTNVMLCGKLQSFVDVVGFTLRTDERSYGVMFLHRSPKARHDALRQQVQTCLASLLDQRVDALVAIGDFNTNMNVDHATPAEVSRASRLQNLMSGFGLNLCHQDTSTSSTDQNTLLDLCFSNMPNFVAHIFESVISDHKPVWFKID